MSAIKIICLFIIILTVRYGNCLKAQSADESQFIVAGNAKLFVRIVGEGEPILIVHGGPGLSHDYLFTGLVDLLSDNYQLIFYDQRASGRSTGSEDTLLLNMSQFIDDIESICSSLNLEKVNVMGHSFGGLMALYFAIKYTHRLDKLILVDSTPASWDPCFPIIQRNIVNRYTPQELEQVTILRKSLVESNDPENIKLFYKIYFRPFFYNPDLSNNLNLGIDHWVTHEPTTNRSIMRDLGQYNILKQLNQITVPTLIIHGASSVLPVECAGIIHSHLPDARMIILEDIGHFPYIEAPDQFARIVKDFL
jgi:proline iminopeptidase